MNKKYWAALALLLLTLLLISGNKSDDPWDNFNSAIESAEFHDAK